MQASRFLRLSIGSLGLTLLALATAAWGQGITTAALSGFVADKQGRPVTNASVVVQHEPSGTRDTAVTRANGQFYFSGLRVGGPYTVTTKGGGLEEVRDLKVFKIEFHQFRCTKRQIKEQS